MRTPRLLALLTLSSLPTAQAELARSGGILGESLTYELSGDPGDFFVLMPSFSAGPTPLAIVDPADPRVMDVGWDLFNLWVGGTLNGAGEATITAPLSASPALQGTVLHAQFLTVPGTTTKVDELSNPASVPLAAHGTTTFTAFGPSDEIDGHTATLLEDGRVLLAGGASSAGGLLTGFRVYDPATGRFSAVGGTMQVGRVAHTATRLADGRVLIVGGGDEGGLLTAAVDIWDPVTETATPAAPMSTPRSQHTATLLADGRVFVAGGVSAFDLADPLGALGSALESTAVYDPGTNAWSAGPNLPLPRFGHAASLLPNGQVLITGGVEVDELLFGVLLPSFSNDCRRYVPSTNSLASAPSFSGGRAFHGQTVLPSGDVLLAGGANGDFLLLTFNALATARRYSASGNSWTSTASLGEARAYGTLLVVDGGLCALGGLSAVDVATGTGTPAQSIETSDALGGAWSATSSMLHPRALPVSVAIEGGTRVLTTGTGDNGSGGTVPDLTAELFVP